MNTADAMDIFCVSIGGIAVLVFIFIIMNGPDA
jgi:hypothetical protein